MKTFILDSGYFMFALVHALDDTKVFENVYGSKYTLKDYCLVKCGDTKEHNNFGCTYSLSVESFPQCFYLRLSVCRDRGTGKWSLPSSIYLYFDISKSVGWKLSFRDYVDRSYLTRYDNFYNNYFSNIEDMIDSAIDVAYKVAADLESLMIKDPVGNVI